jgi:hypothetical protein
MRDKNPPETTGQTLDIGAIIHSSAGIICLLMGALMYFYAWALPVFSGLMILSAVSAIAISWRSDAWVPGHWLAMLPVAGIAIGYFLADWGYTLAYICLWIAFVHFVIRGVQAMRAS